MLTAMGLAGAAGLNAYIPMLVLGLLARYTTLITLPAGWQWLSDGWLLTIVAVLLVVEIIADKFPAVDSINDVLQTVVRPSAGGLVFAAGSSSNTVNSSSGIADSNQWVLILFGVGVALIIHVLKASVRPALNTLTGGLAAPIVSTIEDTSSIVLSILAVLIPILAAVLLIVFVGVMVFLALRCWKRWRRRATEKRVLANPQTLLEN